ncbi:hypothetical protein EON67_03205 [archaeon]|nr:MAG: hypothetical protein EON67_03205 [archaeon]
MRVCARTRSWQHGRMLRAPLRVRRSHTGAALTFPTTDPSAAATPANNANATILPRVCTSSQPTMHTRLPRARGGRRGGQCTPFPQNTNVLPPALHAYVHTRARCLHA